MTSAPAGISLGVSLKGEWYMDTVWEKIKETLREKLPEASYKVWIKPLECIGVNEEKILIACPNPFSLMWIKEHYWTFMEEALKASGLSLKLELIPLEKPVPRKRQVELPYHPARLIGRRLSSRFTFEEFVVGECNRLAYATCWAIANQEPSQHVVYLCASTGLGKSHLSQAVGNHILSQGQRSRICYLTAQDFTAQLVNALKNNNLDEFKERFRQECEILMLDDDHCLAGKEFTPAELALTLDYLYDSDKIVVFTANRPPKEIPKLDESLRSRLQAGALIRINPPDYQTRVNILRRKAQRQGIEISEEVIEYLARNLRGDIRQIESAVIGLVARSSLLREPITLALAQELIQEIAPPTPEVTTDFILDLVCRHFRITRQDLVSRSRARRVSFPRQVAMYLCRQFTDESLQAIGRLFKRDHATVVYALNRVTQKIRHPGPIKYQIEYLCREIEEQLQPHSPARPEEIEAPPREKVS